MSIKVLNLSRSLLANAPIRINNFLNKYGEGKLECRCITTQNGKIKYPQDICWSWHKEIGNKYIEEDLNQLDNLVNWCDIIHIHNQPPIMNGGEGWEIIKRKPVVFQVHSEPEKMYKIYKDFKQVLNIKETLVIAQYQAVYFKYPFVPVRNVVDIYDPIFLPLDQKNVRPIVTFSVSNKSPLDRLQAKRKSTWAYKSFYEVEPILQKLKEEGYLGGFHIFYDRDFEETMKIRQLGDIHIDDIYTGSYHLSSLEGLSQGKLVISNLKDWMIKFLHQFLGKSKLPWTIADKNNLAEMIRILCSNREVIEKAKIYSRKWMEKYWEPELIFNDYYNVYKGIL